MSNKREIRIRIVQVIFLIAIVVTTLFLAKWQWGRYNSASGTVQNLGYALQWPIIGGFFVVAYRKYLQYEKELAAGDETPAVNKEEMKEIPEDFYPARRQEKDNGES